MQATSNPGAALGVVTGKKPAGGWLLYVGLILLASAFLGATGLSGKGVDLGTAGFSFLFGAPIVGLCARYMFQTVEAHPDRLIWKRFLSEIAIPYAEIRSTEYIQHVGRMEVYDEVAITMNDGTVHEITHLKDGNDLLRLLNTYGVRRG